MPTLSDTRSTRKELGVAGVVIALGLTLSACGSAVPAEVEGVPAVDGGDIGAPADERGAAEGLADPHTERPTGNRSVDDFPFPSCDVIARQIGGDLATLVLVEDEVIPPQRPGQGFHKSCIWLTDDPHELGVDDAESMSRAMQVGTVTLLIDVLPMPFTKEEVEAAGFLFHDLRAERVGGYVFAPQNTDLSSPLGMGVTVTVDDVEVRWVAGAGFMHTEGAAITERFTKDWGVEAAVTVHRLIWE